MVFSFSECLFVIWLSQQEHFRQWKPRIVIMPTSSSLVVLQVVPVMTKLASWQLPILGVGFYQFRCVCHNILLTPNTEIPQAFHVLWLIPQIHPKGMSKGCHVSPSDAQGPPKKLTRNNGHSWTLQLPDLLRHRVLLLWEDRPWNIDPLGCWLLKLYQIFLFNTWRHGAYFTNMD